MTAKLRVKIISKNTIAGFQLFDLPQFFADKLVFVTDRQARDYDWLVVYDDLPLRGDERLSLGEEILACPRANTALITYEPSSLKFYGDDYIKQYGLVLTSQGVDYLAHAGRRDMPPVGFWFYGGLAQLAENDQMPEKTGLISMFGSPKAEKFTLHQRRAEFLVELADALGGQVDVFGKGHRWVEHKAEGIDAYRYHIAVENHIGPHHWTENCRMRFSASACPFMLAVPMRLIISPKTVLLRLIFVTRKRLWRGFGRLWWIMNMSAACRPLLRRGGGFWKITISAIWSRGIFWRRKTTQRGGFAGRCEKSKPPVKPPCHHAARSGRVFALCAGQARGAASGAALLCRLSGRARVTYRVIQKRHRISLQQYWRRSAD